MKYLFLILLMAIFLWSCDENHSHTNHEASNGHEFSKENKSKKEPESTPIYSPSNVQLGPPVDFPAVGFEQSHEVEIPFPVDEVFPLYEPDGRGLVYSWWDPIVLREGKNGTPEGLITISHPDGDESVDIFLTVLNMIPKISIYNILYCGKTSSYKE